jgi:hypothetical protein
MSPLSAQSLERSMPPLPSITLRNGDFDPETYFESSFDPLEIVCTYIHAENDENHFVYGTESDAKDGTAENNDVDDGTSANPSTCGPVL